MAKLLLLASLAISAFGCGTFGNLTESQDNKWADGAGQPVIEELELRDGGPKIPDERAGPIFALAECAGLLSGPTNSDEQIRLRITIAEVDRSDLCVLGIDGCRKEGDASTKLPWVLDKGKGEIAINRLLERLGSPRVLAEHFLVVKNGQEATCQSGGSFEPIRYVGSISLQGVAGLPFGVKMDLTPTMMKHMFNSNWIRLEMQTAIASRDFTTGDLTTRNLSTTFEMVDGQTFAVAGLIENDFGKQSNLMSLLASIPIRNSLVESDPRMIPRELVLVITPEIVQPSEKK